MTSSRKLEWIVIWLATIAVFTFGAKFFVDRNIPGFLYAAGGYVAFIVLSFPVFRYFLPSDRRRRDPIPWDKSAITAADQLSELVAIIPSLSVTKSRDGNQLWTTAQKGTHGTWSLGVEARDERIVGYYIQFKHLHSTTFDYGESRGEMESVFIST
jgi:hypothetical protein